MVSIESENNHGSIKVMSADYSTIDEIYSYSQYVNTLLDARYLTRAKTELDMIETRFKTFQNIEMDSINHLLAVDRYIADVASGADTLHISHPTLPEQVTVSFWIMMIMGFMIGLILGSVTVLIRYSLKQRPLQ